MRPLALLVALCLTPAADACFLKCFFKGNKGTQAPAAPAAPAPETIKIPVRLPVVRVVSINGNGYENPEVPANVGGLPVEVRCSFDPVGYTPEHDLNGLGGSAAAALRFEDVRQMWSFDWWTWTFTVEYDFTYRHLPALAPATQYELRMKVGTVASEPKKFHTR
jgi:hypothetical protein